MGSTEDLVVALIWTRYQYRLTRTLLGKLGIPVEQCIFIVESKAVAQGVAPADALEWHPYDEGRGIRGGHARKLVATIMRGRSPGKLVLRNYNSKIGLRLLSLPFDEVYLLEDGLASYIPRSSFGLPFGLREQAHALATRIANAGRVRVFASGRCGKVFRCGLFPEVEDWAGGEFIEVTPWEDGVGAGEPPTSQDVLILDQPLHGPWEGLKRRMLDAAMDNHAGAIMVYMHPSSTAADADAWRAMAGGSPRVGIVQTESTVEEFFTGRPIPANIYAMCSSALYVLRKMHGNGVHTIAFANHEVLSDKRVALAYRALFNLGIPVHMGED